VPQASDSSEDAKQQRAPPRGGAAVVVPSGVGTRTGSPVASSHQVASPPEQERQFPSECAHQLPGCAKESGQHVPQASASSLAARQHLPAGATT